MTLKSVEYLRPVSFNTGEAYSSGSVIRFSAQNGAKVKALFNGTFSLDVMMVHANYPNNGNLTSMATKRCVTMYFDTEEARDDAKSKALTIDTEDIKIALQNQNLHVELHKAMLDPSNDETNDIDVEKDIEPSEDHDRGAVTPL